MSRCEICSGKGSSTARRLNVVVGGQRIISSESREVEIVFKQMKYTKIVNNGNDTKPGISAPT